MKADAVGIADLPVRQPRLPFPNAILLPKLSDYFTDADRARNGGDPAERPPYRIGARDQIVVHVWGRPDLGSVVPFGLDGALRVSTVRPDGTIFLPFVGSLAVSGLSVEEIRQLVEEHYSRVIENPQVEVSLQTCRSQEVTLGGAFLSPGIQFLCEEIQTLGETLRASGGLEPENIDRSRGILTRAGIPYTIDHRAAEMGASPAEQILVEHGDSIWFPRLDERQVYVFGEVSRQGAYAIPARGMTPIEVLSLARLNNLAANSNRVFLVRQYEYGSKTYRFNLADAMQGPEIQLFDGDIIFVPAAPLEKWDRFWRKAIPFTGIRVAPIDVTGN